MTNPNDVANVMWITMPFLLASLVFTVLKCVKNPTQLRFLLIFAFLLAIIANSVLIATLGGFELANFSVLYLLGVTAYNLSIWTSRMYVCLRMAKLSPSPAMSASFQHLAYVSGTLFAMTEVTYVTSAITFYKTNPFVVPASPNETAFACNLVANFMFEFASIYLHVKSLKMFATSNVTGIKLYIISCSTLTCIIFGFVQSGAQITLDVMTELMMAGIQVAILPSSIVLGEAIAIRVGKHFGDSHSAVKTASVNKTGSQVNKTPTGSVQNMNKRAPSKTAIATSSMDKSPIRETPVLVSPSV